MENSTKKFNYEDKIEFIYVELCKLNEKNQIEEYAGTLSGIWVNKPNSNYSLIIDTAEHSYDVLNLENDFKIIYISISDKTANYKHFFTDTEKDQQNAVNIIEDALFYLQNFKKDNKEVVFKEEIDDDVMVYITANFKLPEELKYKRNIVSTIELKSNMIINFLGRDYINKVSNITSVTGSSPTNQTNTVVGAPATVAATAAASTSNIVKAVVQEKKPSPFTVYNKVTKERKKIIETLKKTM